MIARRRLTCSAAPSTVNRPSGVMGTMVRPGRVREARWKCHGDSPVTAAFQRARREAPFAGRAGSRLPGKGNDRRVRRRSQVNPDG